MGLRFRRSIKLIPGVRLNFSLTGISASIGPGGTGLSYRTSLLDTPWSRSHPTARERERLERQARRAAERQGAEAEHESREQVLALLRGILADRATQPLDWALEFGPLPPFSEAPFDPPLTRPTLDSVRSDLRAANPLGPWVLALAGAAAAVALAPQWWLRGVLAIPAVYLAAKAVSLHRLRGEAAGPLLAERIKAFGHAVDEARDQHQRDQETARNAHDAEDRLRRRMLEVEQSKDFSLAADFLAAELSNEDLPIPVEFEIHGNSLSTVDLTVALPPREVVPETRTGVTKTGRLSEKKMSIRDRNGIYEDLASGLVLRLMYETLRVLPFVDRVTAVGVIRLPDGDAEPDPVLRVSWTRSEMQSLDLDQTDPSDLFRLSGGVMTLTRYGELKPLEGAD